MDNTILCEYVNFFSAPLDQFWGRTFNPVTLCWHDFNGPKSAIYMLIFSFSILYFFFSQMLDSTKEEFNCFNFIVGAIYDLLKNILRSTTSLKRNEHFAIYFYLFIFLLCSNMFGLLPYSYTVTSSFSVTFILAFGYFFGINIIGVWKRKWELASIFFADGVPLAISFILVPIEIISYIARVFSLSIRLFANMMSGHALLKILIGFCWALLLSGNGLGIFISLFPWVIVTFIFLLEILIAFLQSYVFITLLAIYINDVTTSH